MLNLGKQVLVKRDYSQILCYCYDLDGTPLYEVWQKFDIDTLITGGVAIFYTDDDYKKFIEENKKYNKEIDEDTIELVDYKKMLTILLSKV